MSKLFEKAAQAVKRRNYDYAIELFLQELTRDPNNAEARRALRAAEMKKFQESGASPEGGAGLYLKALGSIIGATTAKLTKNYEKAMLACEDVLKHAPRHKGTLKLLGDAALLAGHNEAAKVAFDDLLDATDRRSEHALRSLGRIYREEDDLGKSLAYYERLRKVAPSDPEAAKAVRDLAAAGVSKKVEENRTTGDGSFRDMIKDTGEASKLEAQGKRVRTAADASSAVERIKGELTGERSDSTLWKQIGDLHIKAKEYDEAIAAYESSLELKPTNAQVKDSLGDVRLKRLDFKLQKLMSKAKKGDAAAKKAAKQATIERLQFGIEEYERRVADRPTELALRYQLGSQLYKAKRYDDAIGHLQKATSDPRKGINARVLLGKCFASKGMLDLAVKELSKARDAASGDTSMEITYNLAVVLEKAGKGEDAVTEYEKVIEADYNYKDARQRLEALKA